jgi:phage-related protein
VPDKPLVWLGSSRGDVRAFPAAVRRLTGFQLRRVQQGLDPNDWKPMPDVGRGVREIRINVEGAHRVFYVATFEEAVYVLHAFEKKTRKTTRRDVKIGRQRFRALMEMRQEHHDEKQHR